MCGAEVWSGWETKPPTQGPTSGKDMKGTEVLPEEQGLKTQIRQPPHADLHLEEKFL